MSQEQIDLIAQTLKESRPTGNMYGGFNPDYADGHDSGELLQYEKTCKMLANSISTTNPNFDKEKFLQVCGYSD